MEEDKQKSNHRRISPLATALAFTFSGSAFAALHFDPAMINGDPSAVADLSRFESGSAQLPGSYVVDIYLNGNNIDSRPVSFISLEGSDPGIHDNTGLIACLKVKELTEMGVNTAAVRNMANLPEDECVSPGKYIPQAYMAFDFQQMRLDISIPQVAMQNRAQGWIPPERWDEGINAALLSWQFSGSENHGNYGNSRSQYLNLISGLNFGAWRLRDNSTWNNYENSHNHNQRWDHLNTYLQRAIIPLRSELTMGDSTTGSEVFDSVSFRGVQLATDDNMYPDTMRGFAPTIRGTASSNAQVSIRQSGNIIYRTFVAPGAFEIKDLYPLSSGGDLDVIITEADGRTRVFTVPYSSVPMLQREGHIRYGITAGRYRNSSDQYNEPTFAQGTLLWGLPHNITAYGGTQLADKYKAIAIGGGVNMGEWGAVSTDITYADSTLSDGSRHKGQSIRFLYGRSLVTTGTTFQLAGYRYSTEGFHTLDETALRRTSGWTDDNTELVDAAGRPVKRNWVNHYDLYSNKRERLEANITQRMGDLGSMYLTGSRQTYWNNTATTTSLQTSFSSAIGKVSYNLSYGYSKYSGQDKADKTFYLSFTVPLDSLLSGGTTTNSMWATYSANRDSSGHITHQAGLNGTALEQGNLDWSVSQGYERHDGGSGDASLGYQGSYGKASIGYGYSRNYHQVRYGASGSAIVHGDGLTIGQPLGNTNVLVVAPGAADIPVESGTGVSTDWRGYTVVPYATMYRENRIALDISKLNDHTDIDNSVSRVVPTSGAIVRADFKTHSGIRALMTLIRNGKPLPFGTIISVKDGISSGLVGDNGQVYLSGLVPNGELKAQWGSNAAQQCTVHYSMPEEAMKISLVQMRAVCR